MLSDVIKPLALTALAAVFATCHEGCQVPVADQYKAAQLSCVAQAKTLEESKACRKLVDIKFGVDAGHDAGSDGGEK